MQPDGKSDPKTFIEMASDAVPDMSSDSKVLDITEMVFPDCFTADLLEESNLTDVMAHNFLNERFDYPEFNNKKKKNRVPQEGPCAKMRRI